MSLTWPMVRVLPQNNDFHLIKRRQIESRKIFITTRKNFFPFFVFCCQKFFELDHVLFGEFIAEVPLPGFIKFNFTHKVSLFQSFCLKSKDNAQSQNETYRVNKDKNFDFNSF